MNLSKDSPKDPSKSSSKELISWSKSFNLMSRACIFSEPELKVLNFSSINPLLSLLRVSKSLLFINKVPRNSLVEIDLMTVSDNVKPEASCITLNPLSARGVSASEDIYMYSEIASRILFFSCAETFEL